jgi:hypothetical protein
MSVINICNVSTGNPVDSIAQQDNTINNNNNSLPFSKIRRSQPRANSRSFSTYPDVKGKKLFKYILVFSNNEVVPIYSPYKIRITNSLYRKIALDLGVE